MPVLMNINEFYIGVLKNIATVKKGISTNMFFNILINSYHLEQ